MKMAEGLKRYTRDIVCVRYPLSLLSIGNIYYESMFLLTFLDLLRRLQIYLVFFFF